METILYLGECPESVLNNLPENMEVRGDLALWGTEIQSLPKNLNIEGGLNLSGCKKLEFLPKGLKIGAWLNLRACTKLQSLPEGLKVGKYISIYGSGIDRNRVPEHLKETIIG